MKKRLIAALAGVLFVTTCLVPAVSVKAEPTSVNEARSQYEELKNKVLDIQEKVQSLDNDISDLVSQMDDNKSKINDLNDQIDETNDNIDVVKEEISDKEDVLGQRLREVYKTGGQTTSLLNVVFSADSIGDLISKMNSASRIVSIDQKVVNDVVSKKEELDNQVTELQSKQDEIVKLNDEISEKAQEQTEKKQEQEELLSQAKTEKDEFDKLYLSEEERKIVAGPIAICKDSNSSVTELDNALAQLEALKSNQIKSPTVINEINSAITTGKKNKTAKAAEANKVASSSQSTSAPSRGDSSATVTGNGSVQAVINELYKHLGKKYVYGASGPNTFDCSGLTSYVYRVAAGINIGRTTYDQLNVGRPVSQSELQPGDLVFPHSSHVGIYIGGGMMIHAPQTGDVVKVAPVYRFMTARRVIN